MRIIITGGHFSPAYSIIQKIKNGNDLLVIGRRYAFEGDINETYEYKICKKENIPFKSLTAGRLQRKVTRHFLPALLKFPGGIYQSIRMLKEFNPDVVVTFGGYIGLPVVVAASIIKSPIILHEQTQEAGLAAKLIGKVASVILLSFESSKKYFKNRNTILTGNPIRPEIFEDGESVGVINGLPIVYVTGGSTGSHIINQTIITILPELLKEAVVFHQTGNSKENDAYRSSSKNYVAQEFYSAPQVSWLLKNSAAVVSRAGINTVLEMMACATPGILIPLETGQGNEQLQNAGLFKKTGLGTFILQKDLTSEGLLASIRAMIKEQKKYKAHFEDVSPYIFKNAADDISEVILRYGRGEKGRSDKTVTPQ